ncbi:MAG: hypothetical protein IKG46_03595 [Solobacterium sp.]|nr:hypothetical protein [Solobacterium sp.]
MVMDRETVHTVLSNYARTRLKQKENRHTPEQWVDLLNSFVRCVCASECARMCGISPEDVRTEYFRMSMALVREDLKKKRS